MESLLMCGPLSCERSLAKPDPQLIGSRERDALLNQPLSRHGAIENADLMFISAGPSMDLWVRISDIMIIILLKNTTGYRTFRHR